MGELLRSLAKNRPVQLILILTMETLSMEKVPCMENISINQTEYYIKHEVFGKKISRKA